VLSEDLTLLNEYKTTQPVKDILISDDGKYLYTAECYSGVGIYSIDNENIEKISTCKNSPMYDFTITSLQPCANSSYIIAQAGYTRLAIVNVKNKSKPVMTTSTTNGTMYYRNLCQGIVSDKYNVLYDSSKISLFSYNGTTVSKGTVLSNTIASESNGMASLGDKVVAVYGNGYVYFNPETETSTLSKLTVHKIKGISLKGKPVIYGDTMVVSYCPAGEFSIIDISDLDNPVLIGNSTVSSSIDVATITDDYILIPLRNNGILKLSKDI
jgi:hypothetical protein